MTSEGSVLLTAIPKTYLQLPDFTVGLGSQGPGQREPADVEHERDKYSCAATNDTPDNARLPSLLVSGTCFHFREGRQRSAP